LLASPPGFSQRATSFIASQCQGIHQMPFVSRLSTTPNGKDQIRIAAEPFAADAANSLLEDTYRTRTSPPPRAFRPGDSRAGRARLGHVQLAIHPSINKPAAGARRCKPRMTLHAEFVSRSALHPYAPPKIGGGDKIGGGERNRTDDLLLAKQALSQLSYTPVSATGRRHKRTAASPLFSCVSVV
jgi:hypothetical protein